VIASSVLHRLNGYVERVTSGEQVACKSVVAACERHKRDVAAQSSSSFPYHFDDTLASIACDFFPLCLKHSIGKDAGLAFVLEDWQVMLVGSLFGWVRDDDNSRRFRKFYLSLGRKNGKSCLGAGLALYCASLDINPETRVPESVAQVILAATKREQIEKVIFSEVSRMVEQSPYLKSRSQIMNKQVLFRHNQGSIACVGSDKSYDGLNASLVLLDELHAWKHHHQDFYNTMQTGSASRTQPLIGTLTTAGDEKSFIWLDEYRHAKAVATNEYQDESLLSLIYETDDEDDPLDESVWLKANPNLDVSVRCSYLTEQAQRASTRLTINRFTRYHGNRLVTSSEQAFNIDAWDSCCDDLSDWSEADAIGVGCDLGGRDDFAAWGMVARFIDGEKSDQTSDDQDEHASPYVFRYECQAFVYIAEDTERDLTAPPFANWIHEGRIKVAKYPITDMKADILEASYEYEFDDGIAYDPHNGQQFAEDLEQEGLLVARMPQTFAMFNEPLNDFSQAMIDGRLRHSGCPVLRWMIGNAIACRDRQDRWMIDKRKSADKVDGVVSIVMGYRRAMVAGGRSTDENLIIT